jgi:hypothetical protein
MLDPMPTSREMTFVTTIRARPRGGITVALPFDPDAAWGQKDQHYVSGTIGGFAFRGSVEPGPASALELGPSWCRDPSVGAGARVAVAVRPEGPQLDTMASDIAVAIGADAGGRRFFESLATFYRKGFVDWIEQAKRPETRAARIEATVAALKERRRER